MKLPTEEDLDTTKDVLAWWIEYLKEVEPSATNSIYAI